MLTKMRARQVASIRGTVYVVKKCEFPPFPSHSQPLLPSILTLPILGDRPRGSEENVPTLEEMAGRWRRRRDLGTTGVAGALTEASSTAPPT